jgi:hypothetical protein
VKEPRHDDERLAALLEGRLDGPERDELLAYLATADEDLQVFARTAAVLREMEEDEAARAPQPGDRADRPHAPDPTLPSVRPGWRRFRASRWIAVSVILAGLVVSGTFVSRGRAAGDPMRVAASMAQPALPGDWETRDLGATTRRGSVGGAGAAEAGVLLMDLIVAVETGNVDATRLLAERLRSRFDSLGASPLQEIDARAGEPATALRPLLKRATDRLEDRYDPDLLRLGAWAEAAWLAANEQDDGFFRSAATRRMLARAQGLTRDDPDARQAVERVRSALEQPGPRDWATLVPLLDTMIAAIVS